MNWCKFDSINYNSGEFRLHAEKYFDDEVRKARQTVNQNFTMTEPSLINPQLPSLVERELYVGSSPVKAITATRLSGYGEVVVKFGIVDDNIDEFNRTETALYVSIKWGEYLFENLVPITSRRYLYSFMVPYVRAILSGHFEIIKPSPLRSVYTWVSGWVPWKSDFYLIKIFDRENRVLITNILNFNND